MQKSLVVAALLAASLAASAQQYPKAGKLGTYAGTVAISGVETQKNSKVTFHADVKISMPLTSRDARSASAEIGDVDKPSATARITQWDVEAKNASPDSDGKVTSWTCSLVAPVDVPMNAQGVLNIDYTAKTHSLFVALVALKAVPMKCVNSRSGAYKDNATVSLFFGTSEPDVLPYKELPFTDAGRLAARHKLVPAGQMKGHYLPIEQEWDFKLAS